MKHIESILPEQAADELTRLLLDDATILSALKKLLRRDTGCDIPSLNDTPISEIEEIIPLCLSILRRFWNTPLTALGDGANKKSLADTFKRLINDRVQGNEALGIPAANENIPAAISALANRKIDVGNMNIPDGMGLWRIFGNKQTQNNIAANMYAGNNEGWIYDSSSFADWLKLFEDAEEIVIPCASATTNPIKTFYNNNIGAHLNLKRLVFPYCKTFIGGNYWWHETPLENNKELKAEYFDIIAPLLEEIKVSSGVMGWGSYKLRKVWFPQLTTGIGSVFFNTMQGGFERLICLNCGVQTSNTNIKYWNPTMALRTDTDAEDYVDLREDTRFANNLEQFLSNFQHYIADRVADMTGKTALTLTLSPEVYAVLEAQEGQTILATLANKNWNVAQA